MREMMKTAYLGHLPTSCFVSCISLFYGAIAAPSGTYPQEGHERSLRNDVIPSAPLAPAVFS